MYSARRGQFLGEVNVVRDLRADEVDDDWDIVVPKKWQLFGNKVVHAAVLQADSIQYT